MEEQINSKWSIKLINKKKKGELTVEILPKKVLFIKKVNVYNDDVDAKEEMHWDMPNKQIGTIKVKRNISKLSKTERYSLSIFIAVNLLCMFTYLLCFLDNAINLESIGGTLLMITTSILLLLNFLLSIPLFSKIKVKRYLSLYVETTKQENSLYLGNLKTDNGYYIEDTEENYRKLLEISEAISTVRK